MVLNVLNQYSQGRIRTIKNPDFLLRSLEYIWMYISQFTFKTQQVEKGGGLGDVLSIVYSILSIPSYFFYMYSIFTFTFMGFHIWCHI